MYVRHILFFYTKKYKKHMQQLGGHCGGHWEATVEAIGRPLGGHCYAMSEMLRVGKAY